MIALTCAHFTAFETDRCMAGISYLAQAGGGVHNMVLRLPCVQIESRRGEEVRPCARFEEAEEKVA